MKRRALLLSLAFVVLLQAKAGSASDLGLVGYWSFDDGTATDISGHGNNGVLHGCTSTQGVHGGALSFNGTSDYIDFGNPSDLNPTNAISAAVWFRPVSFNGTGNDPIVDKGYTSHTNPYYQYHLGVVGDLYPQGASFGFYLALGGQLRYVTTPAAFWTPNHWYHLAATYDGSMMKLYTDGALIDSLSVTGSLTNYGENMLSGGYNNISAYLPGTIDELRIYDRAISAAEVDSLSFNPEVSGFVVERYANAPHPESPSFAPSGELYVGYDPSLTGSVDPNQIHLIRRAGICETYGPLLPDPDAVLFDGVGLIGPPGSVLVAGNSGPNVGVVEAILPNRTAVVVFGPSSDFPNTNAMAFDSTGRLLMLDEGTHRVLASSGGSPAPLYDLPPGDCTYIAVDHLNRIYTTELSGVISTVRLHDSGGNLINGAVIQGPGRYPLAIGPGGLDWGTDLYTIDGDGLLLRVAGDGDTTRVGSGFTRQSETAFGPDSALYVTVFERDLVLRIARPTLTAVGTVPAQLATRLARPEPNPFNPSTRMRYFLGEPSRVSLCILDVQGRIVRNLIPNIHEEKGWSQATWDGRTRTGEAAGSGVYFAVLRAAGVTATERLVLLR